jgi:predicted SAM-dependent methyltransferase
MSKVWNKRLIKVKGHLKLAAAILTLHHTPLHRKNLTKQIQKINIDRLHVGCGDILLKDWLNITFIRFDFYGILNKLQGSWLLNYDLRQPWPINDGSIQFIAGSHFIEHLDLNAGLKFAREAFRCLKKEGVIRLSCPDLELYARNYLERNQVFFDNPKIREWCAFKQAATCGEILVAKAYDSGGSHKWFYDFESLSHILRQAGFTNIIRCLRLSGKTPDLGILEPEARDLETVYIEAQKA